MSARRGEILSIANGVAMIALETPTACAACGSRGLCAGRRTIEMPVPAGTRPGATVTLSLPEGELLRSALLAYGLPAAAMLAGGIVCAGMGDVAAALGAAAGLGLGLIGARIFAAPPAPTLACPSSGDAP